MVKVLIHQFIQEEHEWMRSLLALTKEQRKSTIGKFCFDCGISYRFLYQVVDGKSAISADTLAALHRRAAELGIEQEIETETLARQTGIMRG